MAAERMPPWLPTKPPSRPEAAPAIQASQPEKRMRSLRRVRPETPAANISKTAKTTLRAWPPTNEGAGQAARPTGEPEAPQHAPIDVRAQQPEPQRRAGKMWNRDGRDRELRTELGCE